MAVVQFAPIKDVSHLRFDEAIAVRHNEVTDIVVTCSLLELALVDFSSFQKKVSPTLALMTASQKQHLEAVRRLRDPTNKTETNPILTALTQDIAEMRAVISKAAEEDGRQ